MKGIKFALLAAAAVLWIIVALPWTLRKDMTARFLNIVKGKWRK